MNMFAFAVCLMVFFSPLAIGYLGKVFGSGLNWIDLILSLVSWFSVAVGVGILCA